MRGSVLGDPRARAGRLNMDATGLGLSWTHLGPGEWYLDGVLMHSWLGGDQRSTAGIRGGILPQGDFGVWQPYLKANLWHGGGGNDVVALDATPIATRRSATSLEIGGGVAAQLGRVVGVYATLAYSTDLDSNSRQGFVGNLGICITF